MNNPIFTLSLIILLICVNTLNAESDTFIVLDQQGKTKLASENVEDILKVLHSGYRVCCGKRIQTGLGDFININRCKNSNQWLQKSNFDKHVPIQQTTYLSFIKDLPVKKGYAIIVECDATHDAVQNGVFQIFPATNPTAYFENYPRGNYLLIVLEIITNEKITKKNIISVRNFPSYLYYADISWNNLESVETDIDKIFTIINNRIISESGK